MGLFAVPIIALRNEKGSYNQRRKQETQTIIIALRNEKGSYNKSLSDFHTEFIIALRNEKGSYNIITQEK